MSLIDHLEDLRKTLIRVILILIASFIICYSLGDYISEFILTPLRNSIGSEGRIVYLGVLDKILSKFQVAFFSSIIFSSPLWFLEIWKFIKPALHLNEIKVIRLFVLLGFIFFILGVSFGHFMLFPVAFKTLMNLGVNNVEATLNLKDHLTLSCKILVFLGMIFQLPNGLVILALMNIVTVESLKKIRRYVYVGFSILAALLTPPDIFTMLGIWIPLVVLFEIGVLAIVFIVNPLKKRQQLGEEKCSA